MHIRLLVIALVVLLCTAGRGLAADKPKTDPQVAQAQFDKLFGEFKDILGQLRQLQDKYQLAPPKEQPQIEEEFNKLVARGNKIAPQLKVAAKAAFLANPKPNKDVSDFLIRMLAEAGATDHYAEALELAKMLIDKGDPEKMVYSLAGLAAFGNNDFAAAKKYLEIAKKEGVLDKNGQKDLQDVDEVQALWNDEQKRRAAEAKADDLPRVKLETTKGNIVIELFENEAPNTTANFISLVEKGFYDGTIFHRVLPGFMAQGGDPGGTGGGGPGYTISCECFETNHRNHFAGSLSMAHTAERDTGGSQFFLNFRPTSHLNGKHTVFGRVIEGMDVLIDLQRVDPEHPVPGVVPDKIIKATVLRKRDHKYEPIKGPAR